MASEIREEDIARLNALVDGELAPSERAAMAARLANERELARAHATLARLKATVGETAEAETAIALPPSRPRRRGLVAAVAGGAVAAALALLLWQGAATTSLWPTAAPDHAGPTEIALASLPTHASVPRLESAGLKLTGVAIKTANSHPLVIATYRGPHGCRLELRAWPVAAVEAGATALQRYRWMVGDIAYELSAYGMPQWRFAIIAQAAEWQTRSADDPGQIERRLREAAAAPPCVG